jgi:hypothetical protein
VRLPERIEGDGLVLRRWREEDAGLLHEAVVDSVEHLRPWMPWIADEPMSVEQRRNLIQRSATGCGRASSAGAS